MKFWGLLFLILGLISLLTTSTAFTTRLLKRSLKSKASKQRERYDNSVNEYMTQRTCFFNEICKEEFTAKFRCRCPLWSFCSSPGRYYNAYCSMSSTGYLWSQSDQISPSLEGQYFRERPRYKVGIT